MFSSVTLVGLQRRLVTASPELIKRQRRRTMRLSRIKSRTKMRYLLNTSLFFFVCAVASVPILAHQGTEAAKCCMSTVERLSPRQVKSRVRHMEPIDPPCCAGNLNLKGTIVLEIAVDADGKPTCTEMG